MTLQKILILTFLLAVAPSVMAKPEPVSYGSLVIEGIAVHPAMALTPEAIKQGRRNYRQHDWARSIGDDILTSANIWLERDKIWIQRHMPGPGAAFAYGFAGCPECGGKTGIWASADCSFDKPGSVKCSRGHTLPNEKYRDSGKGYTGPDGRLHYFVGTYNAWAIENFINGALDLAYAYSLTEDEKYAVRCVEILDGLADIYPTCAIGSWDYPETKPGLNSGRFNRPQYQVGRVLITLANTYDQIYNSTSLQQPSVRNGLTRQQNIEQNMLLDGAWYCYTKSFQFSGLTNGSADYIKGAMVVGVVLGIPEYVKWAVDGPYGIKAMLANNIGRDGTYYETATGYSYYTRSIYRGYAEYLLNYRGSAYPDGINLYKDQRFCSFMEMLNLNTQLGGAMPSYGDAAPTVKPWQVSEKPFEKFDFECLEYLRCRAENPSEKLRYNTLQDWLSDGNPAQHYQDSPSARWFLFHGKPLELARERPGPKQWTDPILQSHVLGQKGFALLRAQQGKPDDNQGVLLRYGPSLNHGNLDDLNFTYHALGHDVTYDLGYALGSAHVYTGWSRQTASHQLVVVNEKSQGGGGAPTGGSLRAMWQGSMTAGAEASAPGGYRSEGVTEYGRTLFLVSDPQTSYALISGIHQPSKSYLLDIFRVAGGSKHDSFTHAPGTDLTFGGVDVGPATSGSLAGKNIAWGDKILIDGDIDGQPNKPYWIAPPGNGYGFLVEPRNLKSNNAWWADWKLPGSKSHVRLWYPHNEQDETVTAWGPGILHDLPDAGYVVRRREPEDGKSVFVTVWEPYTTSNTIESVEEIIFDDGAEQSDWPAVAVRVRHRDGREDLLYSAADETVRKIGEVSIAGRMARMIIKSGEVLVAEGLGLEKFHVSGATDPAMQKPSSYTGTVDSITASEGIFQTSTVLPEDLVAPGSMIYFSSKTYTRNTAYNIRSVENFSTGSLVRLNEDCLLGQGYVEAVDLTSSSLVSPVSHEYAKSLNRKGESGFFTGKRIISESGASTRIKSMGTSQPLVVNVESVAGFQPGYKFSYEDVSAGDKFVIYQSVTLK